MNSDLEPRILLGLALGEFDMPDDAAEHLGEERDDVHEAFTRLTLRGWIAPPLKVTGKGVAYYDQLEATLRDAPDDLFNGIDDTDYRRIAQATYLMGALPDDSEMRQLGVVGLALMLAAVENPDL